MKRKIFLILAVVFAICAQAAEPYCVLSSGKLTFYYDDNKAGKSGTKYDMEYSGDYPKWNAKASSVTSVEFDSSFSQYRPTNGNYWFDSMSKLTSITGLNYLNTSEMESMAYMFASCKLLTSIDVSHFNTDKVTTLQGMFHTCSALTTINLSNFNTENVENMAYLFYQCSKLTSATIGNFKTSKVVLMNSMFFGCEALTSVDVSRWDVSHVGNMNSMFYYCTSLKQLDLPSVTSIGGATILNGASSMEVVNIGPNITNINANAFGGAPAGMVVNLPKSEGEIAGAPWGGVDIVIHYDTPYAGTVPIPES